MSGEEREVLSSKSLNERMEEFKNAVFKRLKERIEKEGCVISDDIYESTDDDTETSSDDENKSDETQPRLIQNDAVNKIIHAYRAYKLKKQLKILSSYSISIRHGRTFNIDTNVEHSKRQSNLYDEFDKMEI